MSDTTMNTPILLMVFNRPEQTARVIERILRVRPKKLFVSADGPRENNEQDAARCSTVRALVDSLPPEIEVQKLYRAKNLGCKRSGVEALEWYFSQVEQGIVLEDDCLPDPSFFSFCEAALERYREEERVMIVSGHNPFGAFPRGTDIFMSKYPFIWGWASWRRAWKHYKSEIAGWDTGDGSRQIRTWLRSQHAVDFWRRAFRGAAEGAEVWDYQLNYAMYMRNAFAAVSGRNLVANIGFGPDAIHTKDAGDSRKLLPVFQAPAHLKFPARLTADIRFERRAIRRLFLNHDHTLLGTLKVFLRRIRNNVHTSG
jgi:hypothetical protein